MDQWRPCQLGACWRCTISKAFAGRQGSSRSAHRSCGDNTGFRSPWGENGSGLQRVGGGKGDPQNPRPLWDVRGYLCRQHMKSPEYLACVLGSTGWTSVSQQRAPGSTLVWFSVLSWVNSSLSMALGERYPVDPLTSLYPRTVPFSSNPLLAVPWISVPLHMLFLYLACLFPFFSNF